MPTPNTWDTQLLNNPHAVPDKRRRVREMFAAIAPSYDLNNRLHSFGQDQRWRRKAVKLAALTGGETVVDVACGTGDLAVAFVHELDKLAQAGKARGTVIGVDFTYEMLPAAVRKSKPGPTQTLYLNADAQALPLTDACCDVVSIAFGIRNVQEPAKAVDEFARILKPGGRLVILEFSEPTNPLLRWGNKLYTAHVMPHTATLISGDRSGAYKYLPRSIETFIDRSTMSKLITAAGFRSVTQTPLTFGVCVCYVGLKT